MTKHARVYARAADEWYVEPGRCTTQLLGVEKLYGTVLDPACGQGNIVKALRAGGVEAYGSDIRDRAGSPDWFLGCHDFLEGQPPIIPDHIVCNPPFYRGDGTESFIRRALSLVKGKVIIFAQTTFLHNSDRVTSLYRELPPDRGWIITPRPSCPPGEYLEAGGEAEGGTTDWSWFVWDASMPAFLRRGDTAIGWVDPTPYLRKRKSKPVAEIAA